MSILGYWRAKRRLVAALGHENSDAVEDAVLRLTGLGRPRDVELLIRVLKSPSMFARQFAAEELGRIRDKRAVRPLVGVFEEPGLGGLDVLGKGPAQEWEKRDVRLTAANALIEIGVTGPEPFIAALHNGESSARYHAARILGSVGKRHLVANLKYR